MRTQDQIRVSLLAAMLVMLGACGQAKVTEYAISTNELQGFQTTVYKLVRQNTCVQCHAKSQSPFFASDDPAVAYEAIMASKKINFQKPEFSRIYQRLKTDKHNCWYDGDCERAASEMLDAIYNWRKTVKDYGTDIGLVTESKPFLENGVPPLPSGAALFDVEDATIKKPANSISGNSLEVGHDSAANKGKFLFVPERGHTTLNAALDDFTNYSYVQFQFHANAGPYRYFARMAGNGKTNDGFFKISLNNAPAKKVGATARTDGSWVWQEIAVPGALVPNGENVIRLGELDDAPKFDMLLAVPSAAVSAIPGDLPGREDFLNRMTGRKATLSFDLEPLLHEKGITLKVDFAVFDESGYFLNNARIEGYNRNLRVQGVRVVQNGIFNPQDSDWAKINKVMITELSYNELDAEKKANTSQADNCKWDKYNYLSCNPMIIQRQIGPSKDTFAIAFEYLDFTVDVPSLDDILLTSDSQANVMRLIQRLCINCHGNLQAANQTHYVVTEAFLDPINGDPNALDVARTIQVLKDGIVSFNGITIASKTYDTGLNWERVVRPRVLDNAGNVIPGSGGENSILYRILKYGEGPSNGKIPPEMEPFRQAILTDPLKGPEILTSLKSWIDSLPPTSDTTPPIMRSIEASNDDIGGSTGAKITIAAIDDLTRVHATLYVDEGTAEAMTVPLTTVSPREFNVAYSWPPANSGINVDPSVSHRFRAVPVDEVGNVGSSTVSTTIGGCELSGLTPGVGNIALNTPYALTANAANRWASAGQSTKLVLKLGNATLGTATAAGSAAVSIANASVSIPTGRNQALTIEATNGDKVDTYSCSKKIDFSTSVVISPSATPTLGQTVQMTVTVTSPFILNLTNIELFRIAPNDPTPHPVTINAPFVTTSTSGQSVSTTFSWTPTDRETQTFRAIVSTDDAQTQFTVNKAFTAQ